MSKLEGIILEDFIRNAIIDIDNALKSASNKTGNTYLFTNGTTDDGKGNIHFDLTVYSEKSSNGESGGKIKVCGLGELGGILGFTNKKYTTSNIKFSICRSKKNSV